MLVIGIGGGIVNSMAAVVLRELAAPSGMSPGQLAVLFLTAIPENLGYRQIRNVRMIASFFGSFRHPRTESRARRPDRAPAMETPKKL